MPWTQLLVSLSIASLVHECGHFIAARLLGVRVKRFGVSWRGFYLVRESGTPLQNAVISGAGPLANLISTGCVFLVHYLGLASVTFAFISLLIGITNLLPIPCSDGHRILALLQNESAGQVVRLESTSATL